MTEYPYQYKIAKCRKPIACNLCHRQIQKGELHRAFYNGKNKEWARCYPTCLKKEDVECAASAIKEVLKKL